MMSSTSRLQKGGSSKIKIVALECILRHTTIEFREYIGRILRYTPELEARYSDAAYYMKPEHNNLPLDPRDVKRYGYPTGYNVSQVPKDKLEEIGALNYNLSIKRSSISPYQPDITKSLWIKEISDEVIHKLRLDKGSVDMIVSEAFNIVSGYIKEYNRINLELTTSQQDVSHGELTLFYIDHGLPMSIENMNMADIYSFKKEYPYAWFNRDNIGFFDMSKEDNADINKELDQIYDDDKQFIFTRIMPKDNISRYRELVENLKETPVSTVPMVLMCDTDGVRFEDDMVFIPEFKRLKPFFRSSIKKSGDVLVLSFPAGIRFMGNVKKNHIITYNGARYMIDTKTTKGVIFCHFVQYKNYGRTSDRSKWLGDVTYVFDEAVPKNIPTNLGYFDMFRYDNGSGESKYNIVKFTSPSHRIFLDRDSAVSYYCKISTVQEIIDNFISEYTPYEDIVRKEYREILPSEDVYIINDNTLINVEHNDITFSDFIKKEVYRVTQSRRLSRIDLWIPTFTGESLINIGGHVLPLKDVINCHYIL